MTEQIFKGAKIALLRGADVLVYLRDDKPDIPFPNHWDLPGGGREGDETPRECALRELREEFGISLARERIHWSRIYTDPYWRSTTHFFVATLAAEEAQGIVFGDEGQCWRFMTIDEFIAHPQGVAHLRMQLADYLAAQGIRAPT